MRCAAPPLQLSAYCVYRKRRRRVAGLAPRCSSHQQHQRVPPVGRVPPVFGARAVVRRGKAAAPRRARHAIDHAMQSRILRLAFYIAAGHGIVSTYYKLVLKDIFIIYI
eukprot:SAG31_NODE_2568_length_5463_cov_3.107196_3_plen_109_part_00